MDRAWPNFTPDQKAIPSQFASVLRDDAIAYAHMATSIGPKAIDQTKSTVKMLLKTVDDLLGQQEGLSYEIQTEVSAYLERIAGLVVDSISERRLDFGAALVPVGDSVGFVAGAFVADGNELAKIVEEIAGKVEYELAHRRSSSILRRTRASAFMLSKQTFQRVSKRLEKCLATS